ncbi:MAG: dimethyl sulfoxide reductase anchor subunit family protein [Bacillota bacterium]
METREWALILFTVLSQAAIGAFILLTWFRQRNRDTAMDGAYRKSSLALLGVTAVGLLASLAHLGRPLLAVTALGNLGSSWLSREIFFSGGFFVLLLASVLLEKQPATRRMIDWLASLAGVLAVLSMSAVYIRTMMPAWQGFNTFVAFLGTMALLGAATAGGLLVTFGRGQEPVARDLQALLWVAVGALVVELAVLPLYLATLGAGAEAAQAAAALLAGKYGAALVLRWALVLVGGLVPLLVVWRKLSSGQVDVNSVYAALAFILVGEVIGRYLFYATGVHIMIG